MASETTTSILHNGGTQRFFFSRSFVWFHPCRPDCLSSVPILTNSERLSCKSMSPLSQPSCEYVGII